VLTRKQLDKVRKQFGRSDLSPWHTHFVEMSQKTAIRRLCKLLPQTAEMARAVEFDERQLTLGDLGLSSIDPELDDVVDVETEEVEP
jgi:recombinational DNA repair protein RecT